MARRGRPLGVPLLLVANQPATRLHSQLDVGAISQAGKVAGREPIRLHPDDAADARHRRRRRRRASSTTAARAWPAPC